MESQSAEWWDRTVLEHDRIVVAGGDATIGLAGRVAAEAGLPLAVIPGGDTNVFAHEMGLPLDIEKSVALAVGRTTRPTRIATAGHHPFAHHASLLARWVIRRKPFQSRIVLDGEEVHDGDTLALQVLPPPAEDPTGGLVARFTAPTARGWSNGDARSWRRRCRSTACSTSTASRSRPSTSPTGRSSASP